MSLATQLFRVHLPSARSTARLVLGPPSPRSVMGQTHLDPTIYPSPDGHPTWRNWARNQIAHPSAVHQPTSEHELTAIVKQAASDGRRVKVVGSGHSFTDIACTDGHLVELTRYNRVLSIDPRRARSPSRPASAWRTSTSISIGAAWRCPTWATSPIRPSREPSSTATHGTGSRLTGLAGQIAALRLVLADGTRRRLLAARGAGAVPLRPGRPRRARHPLDRHARRVPGLQPVRGRGADAGGRGPRGPRRPCRRQRPLRVLLGSPYRLGADQDEQPHARSRWRPAAAVSEWRNDMFLQNYAFGALCRVGRRPAAAGSRGWRRPCQPSGRVTYVDQSYRRVRQPSPRSVLRDGVRHPSGGLSARR